MTEFQVWRSIVDWIEDNEGSVIAACPPGSSVYDYEKFILIDSVTGKHDEPDILFLLHKTIYIVECKRAFSGLLAHGRKRSSDESDIDKLLRIRSAYELGHYDEQMYVNYKIDVSAWDMKIGIGFFEGKDTVHILPDGICQFIVTENGIKVVE